MSIISTDKIKSSLKKIEAEVQHLLELKPTPIDLFEVSTDFENDRFQIQANDREEFYILLFSRLSQSFEKGFLLEASNNYSDKAWTCALHFSEGSISVAEHPIPVEITIPSPGPNKVIKASPLEWNLKTVSWKTLIPVGREWSALLFEISPDIRFLFITRLAEPWLQIQTEKAHQFIERALSLQP
ncbi:MAG: hypothetical protein RJB66_1071 [Pseudomonadota bacterium]|jgi:hypothetical protein